MDCELCSSELTAYLDQELGENRTAQVLKHVQSCPYCAQELESLRQAKALVEDHVSEMELRPEIWKSVRARIATMETPDPSGGFFSWLFASRWRAAAATAMVTLAISAGLWQYLQYREAQADLQRYMSDYIQAREMEDMARNTSNSGFLHIESMENPFVFDQSEDFQSNPFRTEDR